VPDIGWKLGMTELSAAAVGPTGTVGTVAAGVAAGVGAAVALTARGAAVGAAVAGLALDGDTYDPASALLAGTKSTKMDA